MTTTTDLHYLTLHELARRIRTKEVSPVEATEAVLERIEQLNPKLNAYITVMADQALPDAHAPADGAAGGGYRGAPPRVPARAPPPRAPPPPVAPRCSAPPCPPCPPWPASPGVRRC